jgi:serine/threonine protein kinase
MPSASSSLHPALLPPGTPIGPWRVVDWAGQGVHGAVYRAVRVGLERLPPVALKLALIPEHPRFERERELLSRTLHPHIPRLVDHGHWQSPTGARYPWVAMEWVDGVPLYDWALLFRPSAAQQLRLLAQLALTLQYLHAQGAFHRDLKGGNVLVRRSDSRIFLTDFGSGIYPDADTLTPQQLPPGTPAYRSPEAWLFTLQFRHTSERYKAGPPDDVFALGVTACVLATGSYPELGEPRKDERGRWHLDSLVLPQPLLSAQVAPPLRDMILRMLSIRPEQRGTAAQLASELEQAADSLTVSRSPPTTSESGQAAVRCAEVPAPPPVLLPRAPVSSHRWLVTAAAAGALLMGALWMLWDTGTWAPGNSPSTARPVSLGDAASTDTPVPTRPSASEPRAADSPPEPSPGQAQPDKKGRCPHPQQVILNGGCWRRMGVNSQECETFSGQMYQGECYVPIHPPGSKRPNTSSPSPPR